jgi:hypothetical protein
MAVVVLPQRGMNNKPETKVETAGALVASRARVNRARDWVVAAIRRREPYEAQVAKAEAYRSAIKAHAKSTGRRLPVPTVAAILRVLG